MHFLIFILPLFISSAICLDEVIQAASRTRGTTSALPKRIKSTTTLRPHLDTSGESSQIIVSFTKEDCVECCAGLSLYKQHDCNVGCVQKFSTNQQYRSYRNCMSSCAHIVPECKEPCRLTCVQLFTTTTTTKGNPSEKVKRPYPKFKVTQIKRQRYGSYYE